MEIEELDLSTVFQFLDSCRTDDPLNKVYIVGFDGDGQVRTRRRKLRDYLVCEIDGDTSDSKYVYSLGSWFKVARDYLAQVRQGSRGLPDLTETLALPPIHPGEREDAYNTRVAEQRQWLCLDKSLFSFGSSTDRIEACDLVTEDGLLIAVKKMHESATLSHLFAQASVSARLLRTNSRYAETLIAQLHAKWPRRKFDLNRLQFVYAIATRKSGPIADCLFFFSVVNLMEHVQRIRSAGFEVNLCKIAYAR